MVPAPASTGPAGYGVGRRFLRGTCSNVSKEPTMAKMDVSAAKMALAVWNGYVWDARHVHGQWRPVEQALHDAMVWVS